MVVFSGQDRPIFRRNIPSTELNKPQDRDLCIMCKKASVPATRSIVCPFGVMRDSSCPYRDIHLRYDSSFLKKFLFTSEQKG